MARATRKAEKAITVVCDSKEITHPNFPVRWKFGQEMIERITMGLAEGKGYAVLVVARKQGDDFSHFDVRGVNEPLQYFRLMEVARAGEWHLSAYLFERTKLAWGGERTTDLLRSDLENQFLSTKKNWQKSPRFNKYRRRVKYVSNVLLPGEATHKDALREYVVREDYPGHGIVIAADVMTVTVPETIFPPEPPALLAEYVNYFYKGEMPYNQCDFIWRALAMVPGVIPWFVLEFSKRAFLGVVAMAMLLFGFTDWWKVGDRALEPAVNVALINDDVTDDHAEPFLGYGFFLTPGMLIVYGVLFLILSWVWAQVSAPVMGMVKSVGHSVGHTNYHHLQWFVIAGVILTVMWVLLPRIEKFIGPRWTKFWGTQYERRTKRDREKRIAEKVRTLKLGIADAQLVRSYESILTTAPAVTVSLEAVPEELRPSGFTWMSLFKRDHCAPFGG